MRTILGRSIMKVRFKWFLRLPSFSITKKASLHLLFKDLISKLWLTVLKRLLRATYFD